MSKLTAIALFWSFGFIGLWFFYSALQTGTVWAKRNSLTPPWYYKATKEEHPVTYWLNVVALAVVSLLGFVAPLFVGPK